MALQNFINLQFEKGNYVIGIYLDLDTLNKDILIDKLFRYGIRGIPNNWIKSYLTDRTQMTIIKDILSGKSPIDIGVPQGSILV